MRDAALGKERAAFVEFRASVPVRLDVPLAERDLICTYIENLEAVADDALSLLDQHISAEQRRELGMRIINRLQGLDFVGSRRA